MQPADMLVKSASLCDDCYKSAGKRSHKSPNTNASVGNSSQSSTSVSSVINKKITESITEATDILPDDDGYCEIDEIRLPAITAKSPLKKVKDPRRQSAAAPLPPEVKESSESESITMDDASATKSSNTDDATNRNHDTPSDDQTINVSSTTSSSSVSGNTVISNDLDANEHSEVNSAYDSLSQSLSALNVNIEAKSKSDGKRQIRSTSESQCLPKSNIVDAQSPSCHLMFKLLPYVASLNLHISQLLV